MALKTEQDEIMNTHLIASTRKIILLLEFSTLIFICFQSNFNIATMLMALSVSFIHATLFFLGKFNYSKIFIWGLLFSFGLILIYDYNNSIQVSFAGYVVSLVFFTFFMVENPTIRYLYAISFVIGISIIENLKGISVTQIFMFLIPGAGLAGLFITAHRQLELAQNNLERRNFELQKANLSLNTLLESTHTAIWCLNEQGLYTHGNLKFEKLIFKIFNQRLMPHGSFFDLPMSNEEREYWRILFYKSLSGETASSEKEEKNKKGLQYFEHTAYPMLDDNQQICGVTFVSKNITKKRSYEQERRKNQELLNLVINKMPIGFMMFDAAGNLIMVNERLSDYLNLPNDNEIIGKTNIHTHPFLCKMGLSEKYEEAMHGFGILEFEMEIDFSELECSGAAELEKSWFEFIFFRLSPNHYNEGRMVLLTTDITTRKRHEKILVEQNKRFEEYSFTLSHIIRRPVANIISLSALLKEFTYTDEADQTTLKHLHESAKQLDDIIKNLNKNLTASQHFII
jgi:PAS domain-containing protein